VTYLTPDDWYANHGLAPGDARLPQKPMQPVASFSASKGLAPTPPMRGYFGARPTFYQTPSTLTTRSPFAVSDVMWGVHGLGNVPVVMVEHRPGYTGRKIGRRVAADVIAASLLGLGDGSTISQEEAFAISSAIIEKAQEKIKKEIQLAAASNASIAIGLGFIPVVGVVIGPLYSIVTGISNGHYKREAMKVMSGLQNELNELGVAYQVRLQAISDQAFAEEKPAAIQLAISGQALEGLGDLGKFKFKKVFDAVFNPAVQFKALTKVAAAPVHYAVKGAAHVVGGQVGRQLMRADTAAYGGAIKLADKAVQLTHALTGEDILDRTRAAADQARRDFTANMDAQFAKAVAGIQSPQYRSSLRLAIAKMLRENPQIGSLLSASPGQPATEQQLAAAQQFNATVGSPGLTVLPGIVAAGAVLLMMGLKH
jgi:hypothetical protein